MYILIIYSVVEPNGAKRTVNYYADETGFHPTLTYSYGHPVPAVKKVLASPVVGLGATIVKQQPLVHTVPAASYQQVFAPAAVSGAYSTFSGSLNQYAASYGTPVFSVKEARQFIKAPLVAQQAAAILASPPVYKQQQVFAAQPVYQQQVFAAQPVFKQQVFAAQPVFKQQVFAAQPVFKQQQVFAAQPVFKQQQVFAAQPVVVKQQQVLASPPVVIKEQKQVLATPAVVVKEPQEEAVAFPVPVPEVKLEYPLPRPDPTPAAVVKEGYNYLPPQRQLAYPVETVNY